MIRKFISNTFLHTIIGMIVVIIIIIFIISGYYLDYLWFVSQNYSNVFWTNLAISYIFRISGFIIAFLFYLSFYIHSIYHIKYIYPPNVFTKVWKITFLTIAIFLSFFVHGLAFSYYGFDFLRWYYAENSGIQDPVLNQDISFYMLQLPFYDRIILWIQVLVFFNLIYVFFMFHLPIVIANISGIYNKKNILFRFGLVAFLLIGISIITFSIKFYLEPFQLVIKGSSSVVSGSSYIDVYAKFMMYKILAVISILIGISLLFGYIRKKWKIAVFLVATPIVIYFIGIGIYPYILSKFRVKPNEFTAEKEFIEYDLQYTRIGYKLNQIKKATINFQKELSVDTLNRNQDIIQNIRLWDYRPIKETIRQLQEIRLYYEFHDVDIDRYIISGKPRQVLISARELNAKELPKPATQWIPFHLQYTHGYGIVMTPSNQITPEGLPELWIKDFPPTRAQFDLPEIRRPEIYFGELTKHYVIVNTKLAEIDYPTEKGFAQNHYKGKGGIRIGSGLRKFMIALNFDTWKILISEYIKPDSRILIYRQIQEAVKKIAPFLMLDWDPYIVIGKDGKLYWILDAYTVSSYFPYSFRINFHFNRYKIIPYLLSSGPNLYLYQFDKINYIRNSIKIVIDAYNGNIQFFQFDSDPIIEVYKKIYPGLIQPEEKFPKFLLNHIRYPELLFILQAMIYTDYHMQDTKTFYTKEDRWQLASEIVYGSERIVEPYYSILRLDYDKEELETVLMLPFIPNNKQNLIAWMAARCDYHSRYGEIIVYEIPRTKQIYGPMQIEARIDQDADISKDLTLWNQQGSDVIRGNLLIIPIEDSILYVEPIYLQSSQSPFPELKRVIVATGTSLAMGESLENTLQELFLGYTSKKPQSTPQIKQFSRAYQLLQEAKKAIARGNWKDFGLYMEKLEQELKK